MNVDLYILKEKFIIVKFLDWKSFHTSVLSKQTLGEQLFPLL